MRRMFVMDPLVGKGAGNKRLSLGKGYGKKNEIKKEKGAQWKKKCKEDGKNRGVQSSQKERHSALLERGGDESKRIRRREKKGNVQGGKNPGRKSREAKFRQKEDWWGKEREKKKIGKK